MSTAVRLLPAQGHGLDVALRLTGHIDLPAHAGPGGFDHAAIHERTRRLYVAHTANDAVDVIDCTRGVFTHSMGGLPGVAGVLVYGAHDLAFTSNRAEDTVSLFQPEAEDKIVKVGVGVHPNGLAFDSRRGTLLAANVGDPAVPGSFTLSVVDVDSMRLQGAIAVPGRTRWAIYDRGLDRFFVNIAEPAQIIVVAGDAASRIAEPTSPRRRPQGSSSTSTAGGCSARVTRVSSWRWTPRPVAYSAWSRSPGHPT